MCAVVFVVAMVVTVVAVVIGVTMSREYKR